MTITRLTPDVHPGWSGFNDTQRHHGPKCKPFAIGSLVRVSDHTTHPSHLHQLGIVISVIEDLAYPDEYEILLVGSTDTVWFDYSEIECAANGRGER